MASPSFASGAEALRRAADLLRVGEDPEGVHALRVTCRRLRVGLDLAEVRPLRDDLTAIIRGCGLLRDLDVLIEMRGVPEALVAWAVGRRTEERRRALALVGGARFRGMVRAFRSLPDPDPGQAEAGVPKHERRVARAARRFVREDVTDATEDAPHATVHLLFELPALHHAHALRRALRKLRYAREWAGLGSRSLAAAQERYGTLSDQTLLIRCAIAWEHEGGTIPEGFAGSLQRSVLEVLESLQTDAGRIRPA
jgi:CHAD domain-containing protein